MLVHNIHMDTKTVHMDTTTQTKNKGMQDSKYFEQQLTFNYVCSCVDGAYQPFHILYGLILFIFKYIFSTAHVVTMMLIHPPPPEVSTQHSLFLYKHLNTSITYAFTYEQLSQSLGRFTNFHSKPSCVFSSVGIWALPFFIQRLTPTLPTFRPFTSLFRLQMFLDFFFQHSRALEYNSNA